MVESPEASVERFVAAHSVRGRVESREELDAFNSECSGIIPEWYLDILERFPICGMELEWPNSTDADETVGIEWMDIRNMRSEMLECFPGLAIRERGYICVAGCTMGSGDQYYICNSDGDNPTVYQIDHDVSDVSEEVIADGREIIFPTLSELFDSARPA
jgi:hypothetical protein